MKKNLVWLKQDLRSIDQPLLIDGKRNPDEYRFVFFQFLEDISIGSSSQLSFRDQILKSFQSQVKFELEIFTVTKTSFGLHFEELLNSAKPLRVITSAEFAATACELNQSVSILCAKKGIGFEELSTFSLFPEQNLEKLPRIFTEFRKTAEKRAIDLDDLDDSISPESLAPALRRLNYYLFESRKILTYKLTRNGLLAFDDSSHFSPFLACGAVSVKRIWFELERFEKTVEANESTYWMKFELLWREFFLWNAKKYQNQLFQREGLLNRSFSVIEDSKLLERWKMGQTNDEFVNANMNELRQTGWMSNRGRQVAASYLIHDLGLEWMLGAKWFQSQLIDYEPCSNWGNWAYIAGVGNDPRPYRKFNSQLQREVYDPQGEYVKRWLDC